MVRSLATRDFLCLLQTVTEELGEGELPREMFVIGEDLNIHPKMLQQVIDEARLSLSHIQQTNQLLLSPQTPRPDPPTLSDLGLCTEEGESLGTSLVQTTEVVLISEVS